MTIKQAKEIDIVDWLSGQGHNPAKITGKSYWFYSPLHKEKTPSFKVNRQLNRWFDFAEGKGGNLVDLGIIVKQCSVSAFLDQIDNSQITQPALKAKQAANERQQQADTQVRILSIQPIHSMPLIQYLKARKIDYAIASTFLLEAQYSIASKNYYALAFRNDAGGYELRNEYFKGSSSPKDTTFIDNGAQDLAVFEGVFDFLSYKQLHLNQQEKKRNFLILNSTSFFEKSIDKMRLHNKVHLFLDNDKTGQKCSELALKLDSKRFVDERRLYHHYTDLNEWLMRFGQAPKLQSRQKPQ
jgi:Toprim-like/CHC2 zinc finger